VAFDVNDDGILAHVATVVYGPDGRWCFTGEIQTFEWDQCETNHMQAHKVGANVKARRDGGELQHGEIVECIDGGKKFKIRFEDPEELDDVLASTIMQDKKDAATPRESWVLSDNRSSLETSWYFSLAQVPGAGGVAFGFSRPRHSHTDMGWSSVDTLEQMPLPVSSPGSGWQPVQQANGFHVISLQISSDSRVGVLHLVNNSRVESLVKIDFDSPQTQIFHCVLGADVALQLMAVSSTNALVTTRNQQLQLWRGNEPTALTMNFPRLGANSLNARLSSNGSYLLTFDRSVRVYSCASGALDLAMSYEATEEQKICSAWVAGGRLAVETAHVLHANVYVYIYI
jgi:hypothetical protein